jgi:hypothetical protein
MHLSPQMAHVLTLAERKDPFIWRPPLVDGKGSQSRTVGRVATVVTCQRYGWLTRDADLTEAGATILADHRRRLQARQVAQMRRESLKWLRWEHGYRCHGLWRGEARVGFVSLGPLHLWDGVYRWSTESLGGLGEAASLKTAKREVEDAVLAAISKETL